MEKASLIIKGQNIFTGLEPLPRPGAVAIRGDRIIYTGSEEGAKALMDNKTQLYDAGSGLVTAGFHDAHMHFLLAAVSRSPEVCFCGDCKSEDECVSRLGGTADRTAPDQWLLGMGWRHGDWETLRLPTKASLDRVYPNRPVCMISGDLHCLWLNSCGLARLGLNDESQPIPGGVYGRLEDGSLSGYIGEAAATDMMRRVLDLPEERMDAMFTGFMRELNGAGITSVCDMSLTAAPGGDFVRDDVYSRLEKSGRLSVRVNMFPTLTGDLSRPRRLMEEHRGFMLRCGGVKQFYDGVSSCHTAYLKEPYTDAWFEGDRGRPTVPDEEMRKLVLSAIEAGFKVRVHTIGDQAIHKMIDYLEEANALYPSSGALNHCLEHLENFQPEDIARLSACGAIASVQPMHLTLDIATVDGLLGPERVKLMWPFRSLIDAGCTLAFGTDCPVVEPNPYKSLYTAVTRKDTYTQKPENGWNGWECISLAEALTAYTRGAALAAGTQAVLGTLSPGSLADITVTDIDPFTAPPEALLEAKPRLVVLNGRPL